ncbi:heterokaryon incompatibility, partial [Zopfia rhizophila CBS 207.26]
CCRIYVSLDDHPPYEALSYEWKKHEGLTDILCESSTIEVTLNLASALDMLRHPSRERVLWVDGTCINQENDIEKGAQVPMMRDIYAKAKSVIVWLGK